MSSMTTSARIAEVRLAVRDAAASNEFVRRWLPAVAEPPPDSAAARLAFAPAEPPVTPNDPSATTDKAVTDKADDKADDDLSPYWKVSVFADDVDRTRRALAGAPCYVTEPAMFLDIGYLAHFREPGGTEIELVQRTVPPARSMPPSAPTRRQVPDQLGLVTLRVSDRRRFEVFLGRGLGMSLQATMAVDHGGSDPFDLSFWSFATPEEAGRPDPDPASVENRPWLYQLPSTLIELQHHRTPVALKPDSPLVEVRIDVATGDALAVLAARLEAIGVHGDHRSGGAISFPSPDGHRFTAAVARGLAGGRQRRATG